MDPLSAVSTVLSLAPVPYIVSVVSLLIQLLSPRTLEENILLYRTRSQNIGSLSTISAFLAAVQAQFISFTYQKNDRLSQKAANISFFLGVSLNVMGAATGLIGASTLPNPTSLQEDLGAYQRAIDEAELILEATSGPQPTSNVDPLKLWERAHHRHVTHMLITGELISRWNTQSFIYALVMLVGLAVFFLGLIFFMIDTQPRVVWLTILLISCTSYLMIQAVQAAGARGYMPFHRALSRSPLQRLTSRPAFLKERYEWQAAMRRREEVLSVVYEACTSEKRGDTGIPERH